MSYQFMTIVRKSAGICLMLVAFFYMFQIRISHLTYFKWQLALLFWKEYLVCTILLVIGYAMTTIK